MATYEGLWDCPNCKKVGNRGPDKHCGSCGVARSPNIQFYLPENAREVTDEAELDRAEKGPDWTCAYCEGDNRADCKFCTNCGAGQDGSKPREVKEERFAPPAAEPEAKTDYSKFLKGCLGCFGLLVLFLLISMWLNRDVEATLQVMGHAWKRTIVPQVLKTVEESGWAGEIPSGARVHSRHREVHHVDHIQVGSTTKTRQKEEKVQSGTQKVKVGRKDMGNGYFKDVYEDKPVYKTVTRTETYQEPIYRDEPVYRDKLSYSIDKWVEDPALVAQGEDLNPVWPSFTASSKQKEASRKEELWVKVKDGKGKAYTYTAKSETEWRGFQDGQSYKGTVSRDECKALVPK